MQVTRRSDVRAQSAPISGPLYYVYNADNNHIGPVSADLLARGVVAGKLPGDAFVAPVGANSWRPLSQVEEVAAALRTAKAASSLRPTTMVQATIVQVPPPSALPRGIGPAVATLAVVQPQPAVPVVAKEPPKAEEQRPPTDPRLKLLPLAIFGVFAMIGVLETAVTLILR